MNPMRKIDIKAPPRITRRKRPRSIRALYARLKQPPALLHKPGARWPVAVAFILALAIHVGAIAFVEMNSRERLFLVAQNDPAVEDIQIPSM